MLYVTKNQKPKDIKINVNIKLLLLSVWANLSTILKLDKDNPSKNKKQFLNDDFIFEINCLKN